MNFILYKLYILHFFLILRKEKQLKKDICERIAISVTGKTSRNTKRVRIQEIRYKQNSRTHWKMTDTENKETMEIRKRQTRRFMIYSNREATDKMPQKIIPYYIQLTFSQKKERRRFSEQGRDPNKLHYSNSVNCACAFFINFLFKAFR